MRTTALSKPAVVITGATGILGSAVMAEALQRGHRPIAIMRDMSLEQARVRIRAVLSVFGLRSEADEVGIVRGDVRRMWLGMEPRIAGGLLGCARAFIHCAASTSFNPKDNHCVWESNVGGVQNVLDLLSNRGVPFYHVSTAYVAGSRAGTAYERELDDRHGFTNAYERSKWHAESAVREAFDSGRVRGAVFRPGIIVGSSADGAIADFQNIYAFFRLVHLAQTRLAGRESVIRLEGNADTLCNFVPVDWTAKALWRIIESEGPSNQSYHLTDSSGATIADLFTWVNDFVEAFGLRFELVDRLNGNATALETMARAALAHYRPYAFRQPRFDMENTLRATGEHLELPTLDQDYFETLYHFARTRRWKGALSSAHVPQVLLDSPAELEAAALPA
ncbi:MAG: SDR family oxidoreductase [Candidatus Hydrogenedentes bacterium]|nr:SDR family oxidoreductase [Candidatus Hydrogenedentota bacterium]